MSAGSTIGEVQARPLVRPDWLGQVVEAPLEPELPIIDPHHHFSVHTDEGYDLAALQADIASGHRIEATVYIECRANYRPDGPLEMRPVGETKHVVLNLADAGSGSAPASSATPI